MTVTAQYAAEHFEELAAAAAQGNEVSIMSGGGFVLDLRVRAPKAEVHRSLVDADGNRIFGALPCPMSLAEWEAIERDWDKDVIPNLWMNRDGDE